MTQPQRIKRERTKGWRKPENCVIVDRSSRKWGNPYRVGQSYPEEGHNKPITQQQAVDLFRDWITGETFGATLTRGRAMRELRGKNLMCWCKLDQPCHADVLLEIANAPGQRAIVAHLKGGAE